MDHRSEALAELSLGSSARTHEERVEHLMRAQVHATLASASPVAQPGPKGASMMLAEVAEYLRVPVATLRYWRAVGKGPRSRLVGRRVRYERADVDEWLAAQE